MKHLIFTLDVVLALGGLSAQKTGWQPDILRHSSSVATLDLYTQSPIAQRIAAQESVLTTILKQPTSRARN
jgi:hypothetical protein